ncbi:hypothetical protein EJ08DRAFT_655855 [Tothia fuscella]|uniref:Integral membrane bound transporter domain-containing protein n=1 Tax=Tothia fuscella TaxID=1048955 RepID=A0A9P4U4P2_9PEZI|nr:hypothetical protein EJ08DRAFT_655855 [Tothia fuscella]
MSASSASSTGQAGSPRFFRRPMLREATLILPQTGERIKKSFTLRNPGSSENVNGDVRRPLLPRRSTASSQRRTSTDRAIQFVKAASLHAYEIGSSQKGINVLKCSLAYVLGSLAVFLPPIAASLGRNDGKHMVATICVYFHPARSAGSMMEATLLALIAVAYAAFISFTSMAVSVFFGANNLLVLGHIIVLIVFCGGGLGLIGWTKQKLGNPLVNVACSLTSLACITILTKEGSVQSGNFSYEKVLQVLKMVLMGIMVATVVSLVIKPLSARNSLRQDLVKITDLLEEILTVTTRSFLSGSEADLKAASHVQVSNNYKTVFDSLLKNLREAKFEHYLLGTEEEYKIERKLTKCIERLAQDLVGLRSAAATQFSLLAESGSNQKGFMGMDSLASPLQSPLLRVAYDRNPGLTPITEESESPLGASIESHGFSFSDHSQGHVTPPLVTAPADIFSLFIRELGPSMKSLAYTLKEILGELSFEPGEENQIIVNPNFSQSLFDAKTLFQSARRVALEVLYKERTMASSWSPEVAANYEEVAASCGHFSSSLQDFAEDTIEYIDILEQLQEEIEWEPRKRSWKWLRFWRKQDGRRLRTAQHDGHLPAQQNHARRMSQTLPNLRQVHFSRPHLVKKTFNDKLSFHLWRTFSFLRREDIRFAIKVGAGAIIYAMFAFIPTTRPFYTHWRGEWGLLSYMLVCSMTIGASNTTGFQRVLGTCLGAVLAIFAWIVSDNNPFILGFIGWLVSIGCFWVILGLGKGPMGRFILLTYNLSALYAYSLSVKDDDNDDDEGGISPEIWEIVLHRVVAVLTGCLWGLIVTRLIYPISARKKLKHGMSLLWLRMGLIWKRDPLSILLEENNDRSSYMDIRESIELQRFLAYLEGLRESAAHEFELKGPFPNNHYKQILEATGRMLGSFHAMNVVILKDLKASAGEHELLKHTKEERIALSARVSFLFSVLASSMKLEYPITDAVPSIEHTRDRFLAKLFDFRKKADGKDIATDEDYELLYAYALVTGQIADELVSISGVLENLYGVLNEDSLKLR